MERSLALDLADDAQFGAFDHLCLHYGAQVGLEGRVEVAHQVIVHPELNLELVELTQNLKRMLELKEGVDRIVIVLVLNGLLIGVGPVLAKPPGANLEGLCGGKSVAGALVEQS